MKTIIEKRLSNKRFGTLFSNFPTLQDVFKDMNTHRKKIVSDLFAFEHSDSTKQDKQEEYKIMLADKEHEVPSILAAIDSAPTEKVRQKFQKELHELNEDISRLKDALSKNSSFVIIRDTFKFAQSSTGTEEMDAWMDKVGQWFETGVLGEGSVTYNGKTYTYPKPA